MDNHGIHFNTSVSANYLHQLGSKPSWCQLGMTITTYYKCILSCWHHSDEKTSATNSSFNSAACLCSGMNALRSKFRCNTCPKPVLAPQEDTESRETRLEALCSKKSCSFTATEVSNLSKKYFRVKNL